MTLRTKKKSPGPKLPDPELLDLMFSDMQKADIQWKPSDYWLKKYCHPGAAILKKYGFDNFRDYNYPSLGMVYTFTKGLNINAGSLKWYIFELVKKIPGFSHLFQLYENNIAYLKRTMSKQHAELLRLLYFSAVQMDPADSLLKISDSMAGNPTEPLVIENRNYTYDFLRFFLRYCYAARYVDFRKIDCIMEIGSGYGGQAEIVAKIHPHMKFILIDVPPMSYVNEQYLNAAFPGKVLSYRNIRTMDTIRPQQISGKNFFILCPWNMSQLGEACSMLWSVNAFMTMEMQTFENYLAHIRRLISKYIVLISPNSGIKKKEAFKSEETIDAKKEREVFTKDFYPLNERDEQKKEYKTAMFNLPDNLFMIFKKK